MLQGLEGKVALVTGGASGIGRASALAFVREGAKVAVADVDIKEGKETVCMLMQTGGDAIFVQTNVASATEVETMIGKAVETLALDSPSRSTVMICSGVYPFLAIYSPFYDIITGIILGDQVSALLILILCQFSLHLHLHCYSLSSSHL